MDHLHHAHQVATALVQSDPLAVAGFVAILSFSFLASLHCAFMCAPLVCALLGGGGAVTRRSVVIYNGARLASYVGAGALLGAGGGALLRVSAAFGYVLAALLAVLLLAAAVRAMRPAAKGVALPAALQHWLRRCRQKTMALPPSMAAAGLGFITVLFPCMTLTPVLAVAAASGSAGRGAAMLAAFQAGTLAVMVIAPLVPSPFLRAASPAAARRIAPLFLLVAGAVTIFRLLH